MWPLAKLPEISNAGKFRYPWCIFIASRTLARTTLLTTTQTLFASTVPIPYSNTDSKVLYLTFNKAKSFSNFSAGVVYLFVAKLPSHLADFIPTQSHSSSQTAQIPRKANSWAITGFEEASLISPVRVKHSTTSNVRPPSQSGNHEEKYWLPCRVWFMVGSFLLPDRTNIFPSCRRRVK